MMEKEIPIVLHSNGKLINWMVRRGDAVMEGQIIAQYQTEGDSSSALKEMKALRSPQSGYISKIQIQEGEYGKENDSVALLFLCPHDIKFAQMCASCGKDISNLQSGSEFIGYAHPHIEVSMDEARRIDQDTTNRLLETKKLSLVLDLDHTLIHAAVENDLKNKVENVPDIHQFNLPPNPVNYFIKLRPGLKRFLDDLRTRYELHIYTMGTKQYATKIAEIIDYTRELFQEHRIVSRDDVQDMNSKTLTRIFPCENTMVVVVDDREDVWLSGNQVSPNLLKITPFHYFNTVREVNALPKDRQDLGETKDKPEEQPHCEDDTLSHMQRVLTEIHDHFYSNDANEVKDVKSIIQTLKRRVLEGCVIVFSGLIPINDNPERSDLWRQATSFGARCTSEFTEDVTHVVASKPGTTKVNQALSTPGTYLVNVKWLTESMRTWQRCCEYDHPLDTLPVLPEGPPVKKMRRLEKEDVKDESKELEEKRELEDKSKEEKTKAEEDDEMDQLLEKELMEELDDDDDDL